MVNSYHDPTISPQQYANMLRAYSDNEIRNAQALEAEEVRVSGSTATGDTRPKVKKEPEASASSSRRPRTTRNVERKLVTASSRPIIDDDRRTEREETTPSTSEPSRNDGQRTQITVEASTFPSRLRPFPWKIQQHATTACPNDDERAEEIERASRLPSRRRVIPRRRSSLVVCRFDVFHCEKRRRARFHWLACTERAQRCVTQTYG
ncbi:hypothetical protein TKK_0004768 [Trichogramma kaykai]